MGLAPPWSHSERGCAGLAEDQIRRAADAWKNSGAHGERRIEFEHPAVYEIGDVEIAVAVHRHAARRRESIRTDGAGAVDFVRLEVRLSDHQRSGLEVGEIGRAAPSEDSVVHRVGDVKAAGRWVERYLRRVVERRRIHNVLILVNQVGLAERDYRSSAGSERRRVFDDAIVGAVGDEQVARGRRRDPIREAQGVRGRRRKACVGGGAGLAEDHVGGHIRRRIALVEHERPIVAGVADIKVIRAVHRDLGRQA